MKANELMIGDWVMYQGEPIIVYEIDEYYDRINTEPDGYNAITCVEISEITPIPLIAEILEKIGFEAFDYFLKIQINTTYIELRPIQGNMAIWLDWDEDNDGVYADFILPYPKYLHELQHVLRLAGIDKEIKL